MCPSAYVIYHSNQKLMGILKCVSDRIDAFEHSSCVLCHNIFWNFSIGQLFCWDKSRESMPFYLTRKLKAAKEYVVVSAW